MKHEQHAKSVVERVNEQAPSLRRCPYCGTPLRGGRIVCPSHQDVARLEREMWSGQSTPRPAA